MMVEILVTQKHCCCNLWTQWREIRHRRGLAVFIALSLSSTSEPASFHKIGYAYYH